MRYKGIKGKTWEAVRLYICERDNWKCSTCPKTRDQGYVMNAGHYQPVARVGSNNTLSWDEMNIHCQCAYCNGVGQGEQEKMGLYISKKYGEEVRKSLLSRVGKVDPVKDWPMIIEKFKGLRSKL